MKKEYHKLVRDRIPEMIQKQGETPVLRILEEEEYLEALDRKLEEEIREYQEDKSLEELADVLEVILAIYRARGYSEQELREKYLKKHAERGGFENRIYLVSKESCGQAEG